MPQLSIKLTALAFCAGVAALIFCSQQQDFTGQLISLLFATTVGHKLVADILMRWLVVSKSKPAAVADSEADARRQSSRALVP
jgi:hypothetical protein